MDIDSAYYNDMNGAQFRDARELLNKIKEDGIERADIIVDVGNGSGNVTALVAQTIPHRRIFGFDIEEPMVAFARQQNENDPSMEFLTEDISKPWEELHPKLTALENQVNLVWSNRVLHWVKEDQRAVAAKNIWRLLAPGGRLYTNITYMPDVNEHLPEAERLEKEKQVKIPSSKEQEEQWIHVFQEAGLENVTMQVLSKTWTYDDPKILETERHCVHYLRRYVSDDVEDKGEKLEELGYPELWTRAWFSPIGQGQPLAKIEDIEKELITYYLQFRLTGVKSSN